MNDSHVPASPCSSVRDEFDESAYLAFHPDVAAALQAGVVGSAWQHFTLHGAREGRRWQAKPNRRANLGLEISPGDEMFAGDVDHYLDAGESAQRCIEAALFLAGRPASTVRRILDLPCGHGRVLRFLKKAFPEAALTACDLNRHGVAFCAQQFGAEGIESAVDPTRISLFGNYDLIWCGSLLTHLPRNRCAEFLQLFSRALAPGGVIVLTLHGRHYEQLLAAGLRKSDLDAEKAAALLADYRREGFGYVDYPHSAGYGFSLTHPAFFAQEFLPLGEWRQLGYHEYGWDDRQDVVSLQKLPSSRS